MRNVLIKSNGYSQSASLLAHSRRAASQLIFSSLLSKSPPKTGIFYLPPQKKPRFLKYGPVSHSVFSKSEVLFFISILCSYLLTPASLRARF